MSIRSKCLLVYPNVVRAERYRGCLGIFGGRQIPLGLFCLAAWLRRYGCGVDAIDAEARGLPPEAVIAHIRRGGFDALGISTTTAVFHRAAELAVAVKSAFPRLPVIGGGPHVSALPRESLQACEAFDFAIPGEGEETLRETLESLESGAGFGGVRGLVFRGSGQIVANPPRPYIEDLDSLPFPAYDLIPDLSVYHPPPFNYRKRPAANVITSRGCPNECTFCAQATFGRKVRMRSPESVVEEIAMLLGRYGVREIAFADDTFTLRPERVRRIFEFAARRGLRFPWSCKTRVNTVDEDLLRFMRAHGCWHVALGIESGDERILATIRKNIRLEEVEHAVAASRRAGLVTKGYFMIGHPGESPETIAATLRLATRLKLDQIALTLNTPMPGTHQYRHAAECGTLEDTRWPAFSFWQPVFVPAGMTRRELTAWHARFLRRFYLRPAWLLRCAVSLFAHPNSLVQAWNMIRDFLRLGRARKPAPA